MSIFTFTTFEWLFILIGFVIWLATLALMIKLNRENNYLSKSFDSQERTIYGQAAFLGFLEQELDKLERFQQNLALIDIPLDAGPDEETSQDVEILTRKLKAATKLLVLKDEEVTRYAQMARDIQYDYDQYVAFNPHDED